MTATSPPGPASVAEPEHRLDAVLAIEPRGPDSFVARPLGPGRVFGGVTMGLALRAAARTVPDGFVPKSFHAYFLRPGRAGVDAVLDVTRTSGGRSFVTRSVSVHQAGEAILAVLASFHVPEPGDDWHDPNVPQVPAPEDLEPSTTSLGPLDPIEVRSVGGPRDRAFFAPAHPYWCRVREPLPPDETMQRVGVAFVSDYLVVLTPFGATPAPEPAPMITTLDHTVSYHRPVDFSGWLLFSAEPLSVSEGRFLSRGTVHDRSGVLLASFTQEGLVRVARS